MENVIYKDCNLKYIIESITQGTFGIEENSTIMEYQIVSDKYPHIVIQPFVIDLNNSFMNVKHSLAIINHITKDNKTVESIDTECLTFIVFTIDESNNELINMDLTEYLLLQNDNNFILYNDWKLTKI